MGEAADGLSASLPPCKNEEVCGEARERNGLNRGGRKEGGKMEWTRTVMGRENGETDKDRSDMHR